MKDRDRNRDEKESRRASDVMQCDVKKCRVTSGDCLVTVHGCF